MKPVYRVTVLTLITLSFFYACQGEEKSEDDPINYNVLMIMVDDQKPLLEEVVYTPNMDRLEKNSLLFKRAYTPAPACGPSRVALLTGIHPATSGVYYNNQNFREATGWLSKVVDLPRHFKNNGYLTTNYGKIFHHGKQTMDNRESFSKGYFFPFESQEDFNLQEEVKELTVLRGNYWSYGPLPDGYDREDTTKMQQDTKNANRAISLLQQDHDKPFFISLGLFKPHGPWYVPQRYFDMYPIENISIPKGYQENDLDDTPEVARWVATHRGFHEEITKRGLWEKTLQAYYAAITYADEQLGRVLDALEESQYADNTIIIFIGDNGFHTGEKNSWSKFKLWDISTRVPMMIRLPSSFTMEGRVYDQPVSLLSLYPTLIELNHLSLPKSHELEGASLVSILTDTNSKWKPVISTFGRNNHALISSEYYYIRYSNESEELYNTGKDVYQWHNLAYKKAITDSLSQFLPKENAESIFDKEFWPK